MTELSEVLEAFEAATQCEAAIWMHAAGDAALDRARRVDPRVAGDPRIS